MDLVEELTTTTARDMLDLVIGDRLGHGMSRQVYQAAWDPALVVKVEIEAFRFQNVHEWTLWQDSQWNPDITRWLAPCRSITPNGIWLVQERTVPVLESELPDKLPSFLTDVKPDNFGRLPNGRIVCHDYAFTVRNPSLRLRKADW